MFAHTLLDSTGSVLMVYAEIVDNTSQNRHMQALRWADHVLSC